MVSKKGKQSEYWKNKDNIKKAVREVIDNESWETLPNHLILGARGYSGLGGAILKYHGGYPAFRRLLDERAEVPSEDSRLASFLEEYAEAV